jgi:3-oxoacyl-[acyl-carrier-protein] synthase-3
MKGGVGIRALALAFPETVRTNDYFRENYPEVVATAQQKSLSRVWSPHKTRESARDVFNEEMAPFLDDPFRGTVERRVLGPGQSFLSLVTRAAREALAAAAMAPGDVELLLSTAMLPETIGIGDAAYLARELGLRGTAWNFESACSGALVGLQMACALVRSGEYRNALVVVGCSYSRNAAETDSLGWTCGDGAAAFVVGPVAEGTGVLGIKSLHTAETCGSMTYELVAEPERAPRLLMKASPEAGRLLKATSESSLRAACEGAANAAGVSLEQIDFFVFNTPLAWYASFCAKMLGIALERTINTYPLYANTGPVLMPTNLYHAARAGRIKPGDLVLLYTIGSVSSAGAAVLRWGDVGLGPSPVAETPPPGAGHWRPGRR